MNKKRLLSLVLVGILSLGVFVGCGKGESASNGSASSGKVEVVEQKAFESIPETALIPEFVKSRYENSEELLNDYETYMLTFYASEEHRPENAQEFMDKYGLTLDVSTVKDTQQQNPEFYEGVVSYAIAKTNKQDQMMPYVNSMITEAQNYLAVSLLGEKSEVKLADEFKSLKPIDFAQKYLKKNNIEITNVVFPQEMKGFFVGAGTNILALEVTIEGTQDGERFSETKMYDFHFAASKDLREGADLTRNNNIELMAVTDSVLEGVNTFNLETLKSFF